MDSISDPLTETITVMSCAQIGKTDIINNVIGYHIHQDPAPMLYVHPTLEMAQAWSKDRFAPMLRDTPALHGLVADVRTRDSSNTILHKSFRAGHLTAAGANSPSSLASRPVRIVLCDEVDRFPPSAGVEGDPMTLAEKRSQTFWNRKRIRTSTPTVEGVSRIEASWQESDQRHFLVPCPHCNGMSKLMFNPRRGWEHVPSSFLKFDRNNLANTIGFECTHCKKQITEQFKVWMIRHGQWRPTFADRRWHAGFHLNEFVSPWGNWRAIVENFLDSKSNPERLRVWVNTVLGDVWQEEETFTIDIGNLETRVEDFEDVPANALVLTAGVDIQENRIEVVVSGWGLEDEQWIVDRKVFFGHPQRNQDVWRLLELYLFQTDFKHESGNVMRIESIMVDSGFATQTVYEFTRKHIRRMVYAVKGFAGMGRPLIGKASKNNKQRVTVFPIGVDDAKAKIYDRLQIDQPGAAYIHFRRGVCDEDFFLQLTSEKHVTRYQKGFPTKVWELRQGRRNEVLDCMVYAFAAFKLLNINVRALHTAMLKRMESRTNQDVKESNVDTRQRQRRLRTKGGGYWNQFG